MRIIKIIFFSFLALMLIACAGIFILFETFDTDQYLPKLTQKASIVLGRPVSIGHVGLGLSGQGITLDVGPLTVADDIAFTTQPFIRVDRIRIRFDLRSLILQREIHITDILLQSPQIHLIRSQEGNINVRTIGQVSYVSSDIKKSNSTGISGPSTVKSSYGKSLESIGVIIKSITIRDADISFIDQSKTMPLDIWLLNTNASLTDFSLSKPFQLSFTAFPLLLKGISSGEADSPVLKHIAGVVQLNMANMASSGQPTVSCDINITGGIIKNFNIIKTLLSHVLGAFGNIDAIISKLGADDTTIDKMYVQFSFHDKTVFIDDFSIQTDILELTAKGSMDEGLNMDMQTMLHLNDDISATLINELDGLKYFMDDSKRIAIGGNLKGVIPHLKYKPNKDFRKKSKKAFMEEGGNILGALLGGGLK